MKALVVAIVIIVVIGFFILIFFGAARSLDYSDKGGYVYDLFGRDQYRIEADMTPEETHKILDELIKFREERLEKP